MRKKENLFMGIVACLLVAGLLFANAGVAGVRLPMDMNNIPLQDFRYQGASYSVVTDSESFTAVDTGSGVILAIYAVCDATSTSGSIYVVPTTTTTAILTSAAATGIDVPVAAANSSLGVAASKIRLVEPTGIFPFRYDAGLKVKVSLATIDALVVYIDLD